MNLREALKTIRQFHELNPDLTEYLIQADMDHVLLSFDEVDMLEKMGEHCWYVKGDPGESNPIMHYYSIGGSK